MHRKINGNTRDKIRKIPKSRESMPNSLSSRISTLQLLSSNRVLYIQIFLRKGLSTGRAIPPSSLSTRNAILRCAKYYNNNSRAIPERGVLKSWQRRRSEGVDGGRFVAKGTGKRGEREREREKARREDLPAFARSERERERAREIERRARVSAPSPADFGLAGARTRSDYRRRDLKDQRAL